LTQINRAIRSGLIKGVIALGENLVKAGYDADALGKLKVLVSTHILANPTAELSHCRSAFRQLRRKAWQHDQCHRSPATPEQGRQQPRPCP